MAYQVLWKCRLEGLVSLDSLEGLDSLDQPPKPPKPSKPFPKLSKPSSKLSSSSLVYQFFLHPSFPEASYPANHLHRHRYPFLRQ